MYGKIFTQMYEGTLASTGPWEALVTFQQLIVLANRHGEVDMTPDAISRRTTIPIEIIDKGLAALSQRDPDSRTPDEEGRRIQLIDPERAWGWRIVNYEKYRKIRSEDERREYQRQFMANKRIRQKQEKLAAVSNVSPCSKQYAVSSKQEKPLRSETARGGSPPRAEDFERFWSVYPRKKGRVTAQKAWTKVKPEEVKRIITRVEINNHGEWKGKDPQYIPYPASWLNGRRWEDQIEQPRQAIADAEELRHKRTELTPEGKAALEKAGYLE